ncbi:hypothetical protein POTOM_052782 [Populus tomentosa]|uniref:L-ascorbate peroxidase n=1 Tax=Populus tomentosa TaxID=118781 RepID=A0A8X7Y0R9_POPTO|nr:hypothetical protein POTOM_052782 [Populus tomentosa]
MGKCYPTVSEEYQKAVEKCKRKLRGLIAEKHCAPLMLRLAWHSAGTFDVTTKTGGPFGTIRHPDELAHGANNGLDIAVRLLEPLKEQFPNLSYADFYQLAGVVAVEVTGGPEVPFHPGRPIFAVGSFGGLMVSFLSEDHNFELIVNATSLVEFDYFVGHSGGDWPNVLETMDLNNGDISDLYCYRLKLLFRVGLWWDAKGAIQMKKSLLFVGISLQIAMIVLINLAFIQDKSDPPPEGRLPDATKGSDHLRDVFGHMGLSDKDIVALSGGHTLGRCHKERSGFEGPWTPNPLVFDNSYFKELLSGEKEGLIQLPSDKTLLEDPVFRPLVEKYAADEDAFFADYAEAHLKLSELGLDKIYELCEDGNVVGPYLRVSGFCGIVSKLPYM